MQLHTYIHVYNNSDLYLEACSVAPATSHTYVKATLFFIMLKFAGQLNKCSASVE